MTVYSSNRLWILYDLNISCTLNDSAQLQRIRILYDLNTGCALKCNESVQPLANYPEKMRKDGRQTQAQEAMLRSRRRTGQLAASGTVSDAPIPKAD